MNTKRIPVEVRFWRHVSKTRRCWNWTARKLKGYGFISGFDGKKPIKILAHRLSWVIHKGAIPDGQCVMHKCDNPSCVRPSHLFLGTQLQNLQDMDAKGRRRVGIGERHASQKMTILMVKAMRKIRIKFRLSYKQLGIAYGISTNSAWRICTRKTWRHVP